MVLATDERRALPSVLDEVRTVINVFEATLADVLPEVYRRLDDWLLADAAGTTAPAVRPFARLGTWIGGDRDGNPNVTAEITETAAAMASEHALLELESSARKVAHGLTLDASGTPGSAELGALWQRQRGLSAALATRIAELGAQSKLLTSGGLAMGWSSAGCQAATR